MAKRLKVSLPGARVSRPSRMGEVRFVSFNKSVLLEIYRTLAACGRCEPNEIRLGPIRWGPRERGATWARLPLTAAIAVAKKERVALG